MSRRDDYYHPKSNLSLPRRILIGEKRSKIPKPKQARFWGAGAFSLRRHHKRTKPPAAAPNNPTRKRGRRLNPRRRPERARYDRFLPRAWLCTTRGTADLDSCRRRWTDCAACCFGFRPSSLAHYCTARVVRVDLLGESTIVAIGSEILIFHSAVGVRFSVFELG